MGIYMKNMTLANITKAVNGKLYFDNSENIEAEGMVIDSRLVEPGFVFVATKGERVDGHTFIESVFEKGALAVICEKLPEKQYGPCILVEDSFKALYDAAVFYRQQLDVKVVGITGSVGKTSTKECVASILSESFNVLKTQGNFNNEIGVPLTLLRIRDEHQVAVVEMGINHFGEMTRLTNAARPDICVITNIGECHLEFLGDRDGVLKAKSEIFLGMNKDGYVVVNGDDDKLSTIKTVNGKKVIELGIDGEALDLRACEIEENGLLGTSFTIKTENKEIKVSMPLPGRHMIYNGLTGTAVALKLGMSPESIATGISKIQSVGGRSNIIKTEKYIIIDDCYNANPTSVRAAIDMLGQQKGKKLVILGDMFELGDKQCEMHEEVGAYAATHCIDEVICIGELSKNTYEGAKKAKGNPVYFETVQEALKNIKSYINIGDTVLVKASHGMHFETIVKYLTDN